MRCQFCDSGATSGYGVSCTSINKMDALCTIKLMDSELYRSDIYA